MKKSKLLAAFLLALLLVACSASNGENTNPTLEGDKPPSLFVEVADEEYETVLGSYCWNTPSIDGEGSAECVDTAGPVDLLKDKEPIQVKAGEEVRFNMDYSLKPNKIYLEQINEDDKMEIELRDNQFFAPDEKGIYFYNYGAWWMDEEDKNLSHADAFYAFSLEVK